MANSDGIAVPQHHSNGEGKNCFFPPPPYRRSHTQKNPSLPLPRGLLLFRLISPFLRFRHIWNISVLILRQSRLPCDAYRIPLPYPLVGWHFLLLSPRPRQRHITPSFLSFFLSSFLPSLKHQSAKYRKVAEREGRVICKLHGCDQEVMVGGINKVSSIYNRGEFLFYFPSPRLSFQSGDGDDSVAHEAGDATVSILSECLFGADQWLWRG